MFGYDTRPDSLFILAVSVIVAMTWAGAISFLPALLAIVLAEGFGWRSLLYYLLVGGTIGLLADQSYDIFGWIDLADQQLVIMLAAGFLGGFTYWLIAGRLAGLQPPDDSAPVKFADGQEPRP